MSDTDTDELEGMSDEEKAVMNEWETMADTVVEPDEAVPDFDGDEGEGDGDTRILNQDEIDSLLGFDDDASVGSETSGVMALINSAMVNYERLPMLDIVFDRLVRLMSTSLRNLTTDNVEVSKLSISFKALVASSVLI